jgi:hypothetical protein
VYRTVRRRMPGRCSSPGDGPRWSLRTPAGWPPRGGLTGSSRRLRGGDLAETITLLLPDRGQSSDRPLAWWVEERLLPLRGQDPAVQRTEMVRAWRELDRRERFVWNKLITGAFRVGASSGLVQRALAQASGVDEGAISHRLMGGGNDPEFFRRLVAVTGAMPSRPSASATGPPLDAAPRRWANRRVAGRVEVGRDPAHLIRMVRSCGRGARSPYGRFPEVETPRPCCRRGRCRWWLPWLGEAAARAFSDGSGGPRAGRSSSSTGIWSPRPAEVGKTPSLLTERRGDCCRWPAHPR